MLYHFFSFSEGGAGTCLLQLEQLGPAKVAFSSVCISAVTHNLISCTPISEMSPTNMIVLLTGGLDNTD